MDDTTTTNPTSGDVADEGVNTQQTLGLDVENEAPPADGDLLGGELPDQAPEETEEVEHDGKKFRVPKELKPALMMHADYTRKTQEVAETRRALEMQQQQFQQAQHVQRQYIQDYAQLTSIDSQLQALANVNWQQLSQSDPVQAQQLFIQREQLKEARQGLAISLQQKEQMALDQQRQEAARRVKEGQEMLQREIKDWSPELAKTLSEYGVGVGFSQQELSGVQDPRAVRLLHKAYLYDQMVAKAAKPAAAQTPAAKPAGQLPAGKSTVQKDPTQMSDKEFDAWRRKQITKRS